MKKRLAILPVIFLLLLTACSDEEVAALDEPVGVEQTNSASTQLVSTSSDIVGVDEWDTYSHSDDTEPDYAVVFPQDVVNTITITIHPDNWAAMQANMTDMYGEFGTQEDMAGGMGDIAGGVRPEGFDPGAMPEESNPGDSQPPEGFNPDDLPERAAPGGFPPQDGVNPGRGAVGPGDFDGGAVDSDENPMWVPVDITFEGETWSNVGMRFKGNSSLMSAWTEGVMKIGFKLDFDEFEDEFPEIDDQRFYGFKQLTFSGNWNDDSFLREKITADLFREAGVPAAETAFYAVYVDYGEGPIDFGLYTAVESVPDTVIQTQFEDDDGNLYKPSGAAATFAEGSFNEAQYDKETNQDEADYSDMQVLLDALHAGTRTSDPETWRAELEAVFDVDNFLHWLAVNTIVQNWDTYGQMSHNFYLYNDPETGQLTWIPWDNNEALQARAGVGGRGGGRAVTATLDHAAVDDSWPLIRYLLDDPVYYEQYVYYVEDTINNVFVPEELTERYTALHDLIAPYVVGDSGEIEGYTFLNSSTDFDVALDELIEHAYSRYETAQEFLNSR